MFQQRGRAPRRRHRTRRFAFFALLLLVLAAPIGWVTARVPADAYVVLFRDDAVTVPDGAPALTSSTLTALLSESNATAAPIAVAGDGDGVSGRRIDPGRVARHVQDIVARDGIEDVGDVYTAAVGGFSARLTAAQTVAVAADPSVAAVIPDEAITNDDIAAGMAGSIRTTSNPSARVQPGVRRVGARMPSVVALGAGGANVNADVAIIDTGIQRNHPDLNVVGGYNCTSRNRDKWDDNEGHGTHVAGIVGALDNRIGVTGVAPGVRLWSVKVLDRHGRGYISWLVCGIDWVTAQRDKHTPQRPMIEVANMSLAFTLRGGNDAACGRTSDDALHTAICRSVDRGTVYVVAAGNASHSVRRTRPAAYDEVITVSAMADYDGRGGGRGSASQSCPYWSPDRDDTFASFSNYGADVDLIAPGKCVLSTYMHGRYAWMSGTSMAAPHVAGAAVVYRTMFPSANPRQVRMALRAAGTLDWRTGSDPDRYHEKAVWIGQFGGVPDFSVSASRTSAVVTPGARLRLDATIGRVGGFDDPVGISLANAPAGVRATPIVTLEGSVSLSLRVADAARPGRYTLSLVGRSYDLERVRTLTIVIRSPVRNSSIASQRGAIIGQ